MHMKFVYIILCTTLLSCQVPESGLRPRVLVLVGGHSYDTAAFVEMFHSMEGISYDTISYTKLPDLWRSGGLNKVDLLVHYHYLPDAPETDSSMYNDLNRAGIPMLFLHHSLCSYQGWDGYSQMAGGRYVMQGYTLDESLLSDYSHDLQLSVKIADRSHPVTSDVADFEIQDEGYSNIQLSESAVPLLLTSHPDCYPVVGWTHRIEHSTSVTLMLGHDQHAYRNPSYRALICNAIFWLTDNND
jgi:hypothetical protein